MDRIFVRNLVLLGKHGYFAPELEFGQRFEIDIACAYDLRAAGREDDYTKTICYGELAKLAQKVVEGDSVKLIEALAERIAAAILDRWPALTEVTVTIRKPWAPVGLLVDHVGVEITRRRHA